MVQKVVTGLVTAIIAVAIVLVVGFLLLGALGDSSAVQETVTVNNESFTVPAVNANVTLANSNISGFVQVLNATGNEWTNYALNGDSGDNLGELQNLGNTTTCKEGDTCFVYYTWINYDTDAKTAIDDSVTAISPISTTWLPLIVLFGMLGVIALLAFGAIRVFRQ